MKLDELRTYKRILILGYGIEGQATERFLRKFHPSAEIGIADQKDDPNYLDQQATYELAIRTPLLRPKFLTIPYTTATNLFFANVGKPLIGVTGTKGKSTTVSLLHHVLQSAGRKSLLLGNIGPPMLDALTQGIPEDVDIVIELSSYQLEDIHYSPHIACILNIHQELHNHDTYEEYTAAKARITQFQTDTDHLYFNGTQSRVSEIAQSSAAATHDFSQVQLEDIAIDTLLFLTHPLNLQAVWAMSKDMGISSNDFKMACETFQPLEHRISYVGEYGGVKFYDDSASVHPNATILALDSIGEVDTVILGGQNRGYEFDQLAQSLSQHNVSTIILLPETGKLIEAALAHIKTYRPKIIHAQNMKEAVDAAFERTPGGGTCLLSPGGPSYLNYANLHERGADFVSLVTRYEI